MLIVRLTGNPEEYMSMIVRKIQMCAIKNQDQVQNTFDQKFITGLKRMIRGFYKIFHGSAFWTLMTLEEDLELDFSENYLNILR